MNITQLNTFTETCTGCGACRNACPVSAITMVLDDEGFPFPAVDGAKCIDCGKCVDVCQISHPAPQKDAQSFVIAQAADETVRAEGSSGGIMQLLAQAVLDKEGVVYGAAYDAQTKSVIHTDTNTVPLQALLRSKYAQSDISDTFIRAKRDLQQNRQVLFCGTPCQITGLKRFLGKEYENLITVDFFCHGVPSQGLFFDLQQAQERKYGASIKNITFREKRHGWRNQYIVTYFDNRKEVEYKSADFYYYYYFLNNYSLRRSCYTCECYHAHSADLTLADYWAAKNDDDKGISLICVNTAAGAAILEQIQAQLKISAQPEQIDYNIYRHQYNDKNRQRFFYAYQKRGHDYIADKMFKREKQKHDRILKMKRTVLKLLGRGA